VGEWLRRRAMPKLQLKKYRLLRPAAASLSWSKNSEFGCSDRAEKAARMMLDCAFPRLNIPSSCAIPIS